MELVLASSSPIRAKLLRQAGLGVKTEPARIDEDAIREALAAEGAPLRDIADALAETKARKVSTKEPQALVLGADQIAAVDGEILTKPETPAEAEAQLARLSGREHQLLTAAVVCQHGQPIWRHVGTVRLTMHRLSPEFIHAYVARNWPGLSESVGAYKIEEEGVRLFRRIDGDHFHVLGLPLIEFLSYLVERGDLET